MIKINVITNNSNWFHYIRKPDKYLDTRIRKLNLKEKKYYKKKIFVTLLLSGNKEIKKLNRKFRKKNKATDVLSFPFQTKIELKKKLKKEKEIYLGDIIVNYNKIKNKKEIKKFKLEFDCLWVHGLVHLLGYDHISNKDFLKMNMLEKKYINFIND